MADTDIKPGDGEQKIVSLSELDGDDEGTGTGFDTSFGDKPAEETQEGTTPAEGTSEEEKEEEKPEGEEKPDEGTEEGTGEVTAEDFFAEVNKLHGAEVVKVEYPDGVDPLSPEGIQLRDKALLEQGAIRMEEYIKATDPRAYEYMLHRQNGGTDEEWVAKPTISLPEYESFKNSVDLQKQVYTKDLLNRGLDEEVAKALVDKAITDNKLFDRANTAYKAEEKATQDALAAAEQANAARVANEAKVLSEMDQVISDIITNGKTANIVIPDAKRAEFNQFVRDNMFFDGEKFFIMKPISKDNAAEAIQAEYFGFVKGDLKELVERKAKTAVANRFRLGGKGGKTLPSGTSTGTKPGSVPFGEI